jgi:hypothetical protein
VQLFSLILWVVFLLPWWYLLKNKIFNIKVENMKSNSYFFPCCHVFERQEGILSLLAWQWEAGSERGRE